MVTVNGADVILNGLTITAGEGANLGAGLRSTASNTSVQECTFTNNTSGNLGGGAFFSSTGATLTGCTFTGNTANRRGGGAFFSLAVTLTGCTFTGNTANTRGGGAYLNGGGTFTGCTFTGNEASDSGGGTYVNVNGAGKLTGCTFTGNEANDGGGVLFTVGSTLTNCVFASNTATSRGGGAWLRSGGTVINSTFYNNTATAEGGGIRVTFEDADVSTAGIQTSPLNLRNSILIGNTAADAASGHQVRVENSFVANEANIQTNLIQGGADPRGTDQGVVYATPGSRNLTEAGTIDATAAAVFASTTVNAADFLRLSATSPAVNVGNNDYLNNGTPADTDDDITLDATGAARIQGGTVDLGAYESDIKVAQDITFTPPAIGAINTDIELEAMASSGLAVTFELTEEFGVDGITPATDGTVATLASGNILTLVGVGRVTITATQAGNATYVAAMDVEQTITVTKVAQVISFAGSPAVATVGTDIELVVAGGDSGEPVTLMITTGAGLATLSGTTLSPTGVGTVIITAMQDGNANYEAATAMTHEITVGQGTQTLSFAGSPAVATVGTDIELVVAGGASGEPVTLVITTGAGLATLSGTTLSPTGVGTVIITAMQVGNANYEAAPSMTHEIMVGQGTQTIMFTSPAVGTINTDINLIATASSGLDVTFAVTNQSPTSGSGDVATLGSDGTTLTLTGAGTVIITATQAGNTNYAAATQEQTITVSAIPLISQTLMFTSPTAGQTGNTITLIATATSTGVVTFAVTEVQDAGGNVVTDAAADAVATLSGSTLTLLAPGMVTITATQAGGDIGGTIYAAATQTQMITVTDMPPTPQTIAFSSPVEGQAGSTITLVATATSTEAVTFAITEVQDVGGNVVTGADADAVTTLSGSMLTLLAPGTVTVTASQAGGDIGGTIYAAATETQEITITAPPVVVTPQTIMFTSLATGTVGMPITLVATATSTGTVTFAITEVQDADGNVVVGAAADAVATLASSTLTLSAAGTVTITASQAGGDIGGTIYAAATQTQEITITSVVLGIEAAADGFVLYPNPTSGKLHFSKQVGEFRLYGIEGRLLETRKNVHSADLSARPAGLYFVEVVRDGRSLRWRVVRE